MNVAFGISLTGLEVAQRRLEASANNVANINTPAFKASEVVGVALPTGGVRADVRPTNDPASYAPGGNGGTILQSNTDPVREMVARTTAITSYRANVSTMRREDEAERSLLDVKA